MNYQTAIQKAQAGQLTVSDAIDWAIMRQMCIQHLETLTASCDCDVSSNSIMEMKRLYALWNQNREAFVREINFWYNIES